MSADTGAGDHDHGSVDWFKILDIAVWVAVAVVAAIALEWFVGYLVRERISRGATKYLAKTGASTAE